MDQRSDVIDRLSRHQPRRWQRWRCSCGHRNPCPARALALEALTAWNNRDRLDRALAHMRNQAAAQQHTHPPSKEERSGNRRPDRH